MGVESHSSVRAVDVGFGARRSWSGGRSYERSTARAGGPPGLINCCKTSASAEPASRELPERLVEQPRSSCCQRRWRCPIGSRARSRSTPSGAAPSSQTTPPALTSGSSVATRGPWTICLASNNARSRGVTAGARGRGPRARAARAERALRGAAGLRGQEDDAFRALRRGARTPMLVCAYPQGASIRSTSGRARTPALRARRVAAPWCDARGPREQLPTTWSAPLRTRCPAVLAVASTRPSGRSCCSSSRRVGRCRSS